MSKPSIIGKCYCSQIQSEADFTNKLDNVVTKLPNDSNVIILGDMNMCSILFDVYYKKYQDMLTTSVFKQLIYTPTRVAATSKTAIDHVICNNMQKIQQYGVIPYGISDHYHWRRNYFQSGGGDFFKSQMARQRRQSRLRDGGGGV